MKPGLTDNVVLMVCYYFSPISDVGSKRSEAFVKYMPKFGYESKVISVRNPDRSFCSVSDGNRPARNVVYVRSIIKCFWLINNMDAAARKILKFFRIKLERNYFYSLFCFPDHFIGWVPLAAYKSYALIKREKISHVYISCSPHSAVLVGWILKVFAKINLVVDLRDPYYLSSFEKSVPWFRRMINKQYQQFILNVADVTIINNHGTLRRILDEYKCDKKNLKVIYNGYDPDLIDLNTPGGKFAKFTIIYTGNFYFENVSSDGFFKALASLKEDGFFDSESFQFMFFGERGYDIEKIAARFGVADLVQTNGRVSSSEIFRYIKRSHVQLLRIVPPMISTKLFEGIALDVPFLATTNAEEPVKIISEYSPSSEIADPNSYSQIADCIKGLVKKYMSGNVVSNKLDLFEKRFSRKSLTGELCEVFKDALL